MILLKKRTDERYHPCRPLSHQKSDDDEQHQQDRRQPEPLANAKELPEFHRDRHARIAPRQHPINEQGDIMARAAWAGKRFRRPARFGVPYGVGPLIPGKICPIAPKAQNRRTHLENDPCHADRTRAARACGHSAFADRLRRSHRPGRLWRLAFRCARRHPQDHACRSRQAAGDAADRQSVQGRSQARGRRAQGAGGLHGCAVCDRNGRRARHPRRAERRHLPCRKACPARSR